MKNGPVDNTAARLARLLSEVRLDRSEQLLASRCLRRLEQPLRLTIFGTQAAHAVSLLNLLCGRSLVPASLDRVHVHVAYSEECFAELFRRDGTTESHTTENTQDVFSGHPEKARIGADLPVLKKVSFLVVADADPAKLCEHAKVLAPSDIVLWAGETLSDPILKTWSDTPDHVRDHSHLVLSESMGDTSWLPIWDEFVSALKVDPGLAQSAKSRNDKAGFEASGGKALVREVKKEIEGLVQSAKDGAQILLIRNGMDQGKTADHVRSRPISKLEAENQPRRSKPAEVVENKVDETHPETVDQYSRKFSPKTRPIRPEEVTEDKDQSTTPRRVVSVKRVSRAIKSRSPDFSSQVVALADERLREKEEAASKKATPWSLGL